MGWNLNVEFGLANPALYALMYAEPRPDGPPPAAVAALKTLAAHISRIAEVGRLRIDQTRAAQLVHAAGSGTTLALIATPQDRRDMSVSELAREAVIAAIVSDAPATTDPGPAGAAIALRANLPQTNMLTTGEVGLLAELLDRIAAADKHLEHSSVGVRESSSRQMMRSLAFTGTSRHWRAIERVSSTERSPNPHLRYEEPVIVDERQKQEIDMYYRRPPDLAHQRITRDGLVPALAFALPNLPRQLSAYRRTPVAELDGLSELWIQPDRPTKVFLGDASGLRTLSVNEAASLVAHRLRAGFARHFRTPDHYFGSARWLPKINGGPG